MNNETPTQEKSILSMQQLAENHAKQHWGVYFDNEYIADLAIDLTYGQVSIDDYKAGFKERESQLLPIIKELGEALSKVNSWISNHDEWWMDCPDRGGFDNEYVLTTLDKYKNLL